MARFLVLLLVAGALVASAGAPAMVFPTPAVAHPEPGDQDGDEVRDEQDNCPTTPNGSQINTDGLADGGDACDADDDEDGVADPGDNCRVVANPGQENADGDPYGDACPPQDSDGDGKVDPDDNCDFAANADQADLDGDDRGDACDRDVDNDRYDNDFDNCPDGYNPDQADADGDGLGTFCDPEERTAPGPGPGTGTGPGGGPGAPAPSDPGSSQPSVPGPGPGPGPGGADGGPVADAAAPTVALTLGATQRRAEVRDALAVGVRCSEACALDVRLELTAASARRAGLGRKAVRVAGATWALGGAGRTYVVCDWTSAGRKLLRGRRAVQATLVVRAEDRAGNARTVRRAVRLR